MISKYTQLPLLALIVLLFTGCIDKEVTQPYQHQTNTPTEIRAMLLGSDMKDKLDAARQIPRVPKTTRTVILEDVLQRGDTKTRLLLLDHLITLLGPERGQAILNRLSRTDPDPIVRYKASRILRKG